MVGSWECLGCFGSSEPFPSSQDAKNHPRAELPVHGFRRGALLSNGSYCLWIGWQLLENCHSPRTDLTPKNRPPQKGSFIFQPSSFKGSVGFREEQRTLDPEHFPTWNLFVLTRRFGFMEKFGRQNGWMIFVFPYSARTFGQNFLNFFLRRNQGWEVFFQIMDWFT